MGYPHWMGTDHFTGYYVNFLNPVTKQMQEADWWQHNATFEVRGILVLRSVLGFNFFRSSIRVLLHDDKLVFEAISRLVLGINITRSRLRLSCTFCISPCDTAEFRSL